MQMREKLVYTFLLHFSALMLVFLFAGVVQLLFYNSLLDSLRNPIIYSMVHVMQVTTHIHLGRLLVGMITFIFFVPLDISILYSVSRELFEKDDIMTGIEDGIKRYPLFLVFFSDLYFFSFTYTWFAPVVLYILFRFLEPDVSWKAHVVSTILVGVWLLPVAIAGRIPHIIIRNVLTFLFYLALVFPFFVHAWISREGLLTKPSQKTSN